MRKPKYIRLFELEWTKDSGGGTTHIYAEDLRDAIKEFYDYWGYSYDRTVYKIELIETFYSNPESSNPEHL